MPVIELLDYPGFRTGLAVGTVSLLAILFVVVRGRRSGSGRLPPVAGIALVAAAVVALDLEGPRTLLSGRVVAGLALLLIGPFVAAVSRGDRRVPPWVAALAAIPGGAVVAWAASAANSTDWVPLLVFASTVIGGALVADFDYGNARAGLGPVLLAIAVVGMYSTLPDTEQVIVVMGVTLPLAFLGTPIALAAIGPGAYGVVGLVGWVAAVGGRGRPGAVVGAIACLGVMLVEPLARRAMRARACSPRRPASVRTVLVILLQLAVVAVTTRVAGLEASAKSAAAISVIALAAAALALVLLLAPWPAASRPPATPPGSRDAPENGAEPSA